MAKKKSGHEANPQENAPAGAGGFVPATYQSKSKKNAQSQAGQPIVNGTLAQYSRNNAHYAAADSGMSRGKKVAIGIIIAILVGAVVALGVYVYKEYQKELVNADLHQMAEEELKAVDEQLTGHTTFEEPFTVLLLGSDARADDPDMGARTDTIILVRVDPTINRISMVSIPRDTRIEIEGHGVQKFNAAYTYGGPSGTIAEVKKLTGVDIDHYAEINFEGLVGLVDAIGGIDVVVDEEIDDEDAGGHIDKGEQHLDGEHALILARSRAYVDGDYSRQANQRKVIMAIVNKGLTAPAGELTGLIQASTKFLKTDKGIDVDFIKDLAEQIRHNNDYPVEIFTASIPSSTATIDEISWVIADTAGTKAMMKLFSAGKDVSQGVKESSISEDIAAARGTDDGTPEEGAIGVSYYEESSGYEGGGDNGQGADAPIDYTQSPELYEENYDASSDLQEAGGADGTGDAGATGYTEDEAGYADGATESQE